MRIETGLGVGLAELPEIVFDASAREVAQDFELELKTSKGEVTHLRRIRAKTCGELVDVLVAAMSLALESLGSEPPRDEESRPAPVASTEPESAALAEPAPTRRRRARSSPVPVGKTPKLSGSVAASAIVDVGAFPEPAPGAELRLGVAGAGGEHAHSAC